MTDGGVLHELGLYAAARVIRNGDVSSEAYVGTLLQRARGRADVNAFITIGEASVLEAARDADRRRRGGRVAPLLGVTLAVKDSYLTRGLGTTIGTSVLSTFTPTRDAAAVVAIKEAGGIVFGKNNLVEMSYGLTGLSEHYGQVKNPYDTRHITIMGDDGAGWNRVIAGVAARCAKARHAAVVRRRGADIRCIHGVRQGRSHCGHGNHATHRKFH